MRKLDEVAWAQIVFCWLVLLGCACWLLDRREEQRPARVLAGIELSATVVCAHVIEEVSR